MVSSEPASRDDDGAPEIVSTFAHDPEMQDLILRFRTALPGRVGAISTAIVLHNQAATVAHEIALCVCILAVMAVSYLIFRLSASGARWLSPIALSITTRVMGLLLAAVAIQFMLNAAQTLKSEWFPRAVS